MLTPHHAVVIDCETNRPAGDG